MMRRFIAFWLAVSIGFFTVVTPARALAPVAVLSSPVLWRLGVATLGLVSGMAAQPHVSGAIGAVVDYIQVSDNQGNSSRIGLSNDPARVPAAPSAPATATPIVGDGITSGATVGGTTLNAYCQSWANSQLPYSGCGTTFSIGAGSNGNARCTAFYADGRACAVQDVAYTPESTCPDGYEKSGGGCALVNPRLAASDKNCDLLPVNGKFSYNDADCPDGVTFDHSKGVPGIRREGEMAWMYGTNSYGDPVLARVIINPDGTQEVMYAKRILANVETTTVNLSSGGQIQSVSVELAPGQITAPLNSAAVLPGVGTAVDTPQVVTDQTKAPIVQFPDDYARDATLSRTAQAVENLSKPTETSDPIIPGTTLFEDSFFKTTFGALKGWQLPSHSSQCPTGSIDLFGAPRIINAHCTLLNDQAAQLQAAMMVVWTLLGLFIVLRA